MENERFIYFVEGVDYIWKRFVTLKLKNIKAIKRLK
jgi:hypothetical protein